MGAITKFMNMIKGEENYEEVEEYVEDEAMEENKAKRSYIDVEEPTYSNQTRNSSYRSIPMNTAVSSSQMVITQPNCFEDVQEVGEYFKNKKSVIVNLENVTKEDARRIIDFLSGAAFIVDGTLQKISNLIYLVTPKNVDVRDDTEKSKYKEKLSFSWMK